MCDILTPTGGSVSPKVGLLLNERILNMSPYLVPTLHEQFMVDLDWLKKEEPNDFSKFAFEHVLVLSKIYQDVEGEKGQESGKKLKPQQRNLEEFVFQKFEDKNMIQKSLVHFRFEGMSQKN